MQAITRERMPRWVFITAAFLSVGSASAEFTEQPLGSRSTLIDKDGNPIRDSAFALLMDSLLSTPSNLPNAHSAAFFFSTCFGGGMIDDLALALPPELPFLGASAARHDEPSWTQRSRREAIELGISSPEDFAVDAMGFWTRPLAASLGNGASTLLNVAETAELNDAAGPHGAQLLTETPQIFHRSGDVPVRDPSATSFHAILWAGDTDYDAHFNDISRMYDTLSSAWGDPATSPNVTINVLFGNGQTNVAGQALPEKWNPKPATDHELGLVVDGLKPLMSPSEQFLFYASDHGGSESRFFAGPPVFINPSGTYTTPFEISPFLEDDLRGDPDNIPAIRVDVFPTGPNPTGNIEIFIDGTPIGVLDVAVDTGVQYVPIDESLLLPDGDGGGGGAFALGGALSHMLELRNSSNVTMVMTQAAFFSGAISQIAIPEPGGAVLVIVCLLQFRRR